MPSNFALFFLSVCWNFFRITALDLRTIPTISEESRWPAAPSSSKETSAEGAGMLARQLFNVTAVAEQTVYLNCKTSRKDAEKLDWRRDNQLLPANHRQFVFPNGTLVVQRVDGRLDSGYYTCKQDRGNGAVQQLEYHLLVIIPPRIDPLVFPSDLSPLARVRVSCLVSRGDPPISIQWFKDGQRLTQATAAQQDIVLQDIDEYASFLAIASLSVHHAGNYTCQASNRAAQDARTARLTVNVPAYWVQEPSDVFALHKTDLRLTCQANGNPKPVIEWKKAVSGSLGTYAPVTTNRSVLFDNGTLLLHSVERIDAGSYLCQATNGIGPAISKVVQFTVKAPAYFLTDKEMFTTSLGSAAALECQAYGDLPISVSWVYKDQPLKEGVYDRLAFQSQNLLDGIKSTLKISRSQRGDSGDYACKVTNEYGSATKLLTFLVQEAPEAPRDLVVVATNSRMANIAWTAGYDGNSPIINFILEWKTSARNSPTNGNVKWTTEHTPGNSSSYTLKSLRPANRYDIRVRAENLLGQSVASAAVQILTDEEAPSEVPRDVVAAASSSTGINLTWKAPAPETHNGLLQGYIIGYRVENSSEAFAYKTVKSDGKKDEAVTLKDLRKYTPYAVVLQAYNAMGSGPKLDLPTVWTHEDVPVEAPRSISAIVESAQRISVTWEQLPEESINGILLGYKVLYKPLTDWTSQPDVKTVQDTSCVLEGLRKFTNYTIQVLAFNKMGDGVVSSITYAHTLPDVPSHPADMKVVVTSASSILVTWSEPEEKNGLIKQYNVYLRVPNGKKDKKRVVYPDGSLNKYEFRDLTTNTQYEFWVTAETDVGEGAASFRLKQAPETTGPAKIASFPVVVSTPIGGSAVLPCLAVGFPAPTVEWWKGSRIIRNNGIVDVLTNGSLSMKNMQTSDAGRYTCKTKNLYGDDAMEITLEVQRPPVPPNISVVSSRTDSLVVEWKMLYDGGSTVKGYTLYYRPMAGAWKSIRLPANFQTYTLKHLVCGQMYHVYMTAYNDVGTSESSDAVTASTSGHAPVSSDLQSLLVANSSSVLVFLSTWKSGGCAIQSFAMKYQVYHEVVEWKTVGDLIPGDAESITISDLAPETLYRMKLLAVNEAGRTEREYMFGTLTEGGESMMPEVVLQKEKSILPFHKDSSKIYPLIVGVLVVLVLFIVVVYVNIRRRYQKFPSTDLDANIRRDITAQALRRMDMERTPKKSASLQSPWQTAGQFSCDPKNHSPICLPSPARQWQPPLRNNDDTQRQPSFYGSPKRLNTAVRPRTEIIRTQIEMDGLGHYQTPSNRTIKRDESTPDSGFSGSNIKHTDGDSFRRESVQRLSNGSTSDSDNLHKLNLSFHKSRPKPAPRRRPPTRPRHMGTASLLRTKQPVASSSSPSSAEDLPYAYCTNRLPHRQPQITIDFPSPPHSDYEDSIRQTQQRRAHEAFNLQHRYSVNVHSLDEYGVYEHEDTVDEPLQPTTTV